MNRRFAILLAFIFGAAMPYTFAPYNFWPLAFIALSGWLFLLMHHQKHALKLGFAFGFGWFGLGGWWLADTIQTYGHLPYIVGIAVVVILGFMFTLFILFWAWTFAKLHKKRVDILWLFPALGVIEEWLRSFVFTGLPWTALGNLIVETPASSWLSIVGSYGATGFLLFIAASIVLLFERNTKKLGIFSLMACTVIIYFSPQIQIPKAATHTAALIQPVTPQDQIWDADFVKSVMFKLVFLSDQAADSDLIVWPEAAVPIYLSANQSWDNWLNQNIEGWDGSLLFGGLNVAVGNKAQNGLFLAQKDAPRQFAGKHHLVPFGEYVPSWLPFLGKIVPDLADFHPASDNGILTLKKGNGAYKIGSIICYESMFPEESFSRVRNGANVLVVVTNDTWYGTSPAAWQHFQASQVRAIENGRYVLRAANSGVSAIIAPDGSIQHTMPWWEEGIVRGNFQPLTHFTTYQQWGDTPVLALSFLMLLVSLLQLRRRKETTL